MATQSEKDRKYIGELKAQIKALDSQNQAFNREVADLRKQEKAREAAKAQVKALQAALDKAEAQVDSLSAANQIASDKIVRLENEADAGRKIVEGLKGLGL